MVVALKKYHIFGFIMFYYNHNPKLYHCQISLDYVFFKKIKLYNVK